MNDNNGIDLDKPLSFEINIKTVSAFIGLVLSLFVLGGFIKDSIHQNINFPYNETEKFKIEMRFKGIESRVEALENHHENVDGKLDLILEKLEK